MSHTILIVDDEESIRTSLRGILEDEAFNVLEADSGEAALRLLAKREVSALLLDIWMEGMDGIETLRRIKEPEQMSDDFPHPLNPDAPVIMMSGHGTIDTAVQATRHGAYDFLEKPLSLERVLLLLDRAIREYRLKRENRELKRRVESDFAMLGDSAPLNVWMNRSAASPPPMAGC
ncbi:hypothetical protein MAIT1_05079 [Magnetofaba australis IT-1]|uniref:Response regulatory domain-containing protein n=1 Tax=Magnetofaba australis IT-1 TaxID=1434232 RepID=A0A1Y2K8G7_9PROT|nr:response regulator [Magnetofaba australis]OSM07050.1 hypothetical protein MAIT1_05079 [Magnetofaba australis IT-1]